MDFDQYRDTYVENLERAIGPVGDPELFTRVKAHTLLDLAGRLVGPPSDLSFLDVGCGPGLTDALLMPSVGAMTGADVSAAMIERARLANPGARYERTTDGGCRSLTGHSPSHLRFACCTTSIRASGQRSPPNWHA